MHSALHCVTWCSRCDTTLLSCPTTLGLVMLSITALCYRPRCCFAFSQPSLFLPSSLPPVFPGLCSLCGQFSAPQSYFVQIDGILNKLYTVSGPLSRCHLSSLAHSSRLPLCPVLLSRHPVCLLCTPSLDPLSRIFSLSLHCHVLFLCPFSRMGIGHQLREYIDDTEDYINIQVINCPGEGRGKGGGGLRDLYLPTGSHHGPRGVCFQEGED